MPNAGWEFPYTNIIQCGSKIVLPTWFKIQVGCRDLANGDKMVG